VRQLGPLLSSAVVAYALYEYVAIRLTQSLRLLRTSALSMSASSYYSVLKNKLTRLTDEVFNFVSVLTKHSATQCNTLQIEIRRAVHRATNRFATTVNGTHFFVYGDLGRDTSRPVLPGQYQI
jgi:hypothetical protein